MVGVLVGIFSFSLSHAKMFQQVKREMVSALAITMTSFHAWQSSETVVINAFLACFYSGFVNVGASTLSSLFNLERRLFSVKNLIGKEVFYLGI